MWQYFGSVGIAELPLLATICNVVSFDGFAAAIIVLAEATIGCILS